MRTPGLPFLLLLALAAAGCGAHAAAPHARGGLNVLTAEEMQGRDYSNLFEAIRILRGNWVRERPPSDYLGTTPERAQVFLGGQRVGDVEFLRTLNVGEVDSVRYLTFTEAATQFGHLAGASPAIVITLKRGI
jgi:hypothetical protein